MTKLDSHETKTAFAARVGLTKGRISQLVAEGLPVRADGRIDVAVGLAWIETNLDPARRNPGGAAVPTRATTTLAEAKRLHEIVKVQRAKLAFERDGLATVLFRPLDSELCDQGGRTWHRDAARNFDMRRYGWH